MGVANLQAWADITEVVRLPQIESDIIDLETLHTDTAALLSAKSQEFNDRLDVHTVGIAVNVTSASGAQIDATDALAQIYTTALDAKTYTDAEIQKLGTDMQAAFAVSVGDLQTLLSAQITADTAANLPAVDSTVSAAMADLDAIQAAFNNSYGAFDSVSTELLDVLLPNYNQAVADIDAATATAKLRMDTFLTGFTAPFNSFG